MPSAAGTSGSVGSLPPTIVGDLGVRQAGEVVVGDRSVAVCRAAVRVHRPGPSSLSPAGLEAVSGRSSTGVARRASGRGRVNRLAMGDGDQPRLDVGVGRQIRVGPECRQKCLRPRVLRVRRPDDSPADTQHGRRMCGDDAFERSFRIHTQ